MAKDIQSLVGKCLVTERIKPIDGEKQKQILKIDEIETGFWYGGPFDYWVYAQEIYPHKSPGHRSYPISKKVLKRLAAGEKVVDEKFLNRSWKLKDCDNLDRFLKS